MYKKTGKSHHYLPRKGSYSTHPKRNGAVDVLPPEAREPLYDAASQIEDGERRLHELNNQRDALVEKLALSKGIERLQQKHAARTDGPADFHNRLASIDQEIATLRKHVGALRALLRGSGVATLDQAFMKIAAAELAEDVYKNLAAKAQRILNAARATTGRTK